MTNRHLKTSSQGKTNLKGEKEHFLSTDLAKIKKRNWFYDVGKGEVKPC